MLAEGIREIRITPASIAGLLLETGYFESMEH
jgi:hypothetical protein